MGELKFKGTLYGQEILISKSISKYIELYITQDFLIIIIYDEEQGQDVEFIFNIDEIQMIGVNEQLDTTVTRYNDEDYNFAIPGQKYHHFLNQSLNQPREKKKEALEQIEKEKSKEIAEMALKREEEEVYDSLKEQLLELDESDEVTLDQICKVIKKNF